MELSKCSEARTFEFGLDIKVETNFFCDWLIVNLVVYVFAKKFHCRKTQMQNRKSSWAEFPEE